MNYEEKVKTLEEIATKLEQDLPLEQALELYKQGVGLIKECLTGLEEVKGTISKVKQDLDSYIEEKIK